MVRTDAEPDTKSFPKIPYKKFTKALQDYTMRPIFP